MWAKLPRSTWFLLPVLFLGGAASRLAHPQGLGPASGTAARPVAFTLDLQSSRVYIKVGAGARFGHGHGIEGRLASGSLTLGGRGELVIDLKTFVVDTPESRRYVGLSGVLSNSDRETATAQLRGSRVLDVARHPRATYTIKSAQPRDGQAPGAPGLYKLTGQLNLHGVVRQVTLLALAERTDTPGDLRLRGSISILQSDFGITPYSAFGGTLRVADRVDIWGDFVLHTGG